MMNSSISIDKHGQKALAKPDEHRRAIGFMEVRILLEQ
jgi:hypothetical protein